jgi:hypothetical protein
MKPNSRQKLHKKAHVRAVWTGRDGKVRVGVDHKVSAHRLTSEDMVPSEVDGKETDVVGLGPVRPLLIPAETTEGLPLGPRELTRRRRPCPGGFSVGHHRITAGTLGCWVKKNGEWVLLSNNHVLANSNDATEGDHITQPGPHDLDGLTTEPGNWIARLKEFAIISHGQDNGGGCSIPIPGLFKKAKPRGAIEQPYPNLIDAAYAEPFGGVSNAVDAAIHEIGVPAGMRSPVVGEPPKKTGRTTEHTTDDEIESDDLSVQVNYGSFLALFEKQLLIVSEPGRPFSQGGDSGSAIVGDDNYLIGLLFAGGQLDDGRDATIANNIDFVREILGVSL